MDNSSNNPEKMKFEIVHKDYTQDFVINGKKISIDAFLSIKALITYFEYTKQCSDYRKSFSKIAYFMYSITDNSSQGDINLSEKDFNVASDDELSVVMAAILKNDSHLSAKFDEITEGNQYAKFYEANKNSCDEIFASLKKAIGNQKLNVVSGLQRALGQNRSLFSNYHSNRLNSLYASSLDCVAKIQATRFNRFAKHLNSINLLNTRSLQLTLSPVMQSIQNAIQEFNFTEKLKPISKEIFQNRKMFITAALNLQKAFAAIDFSMFTYHREWSEKHEFLISHGWFYLNELSSETIDKIYEQRETITTEQIDTQICEYFRDNNCAALKKIVKNWRSSPYFRVREEIFHQSMVNHSRRYYNASITLMVIHTEGVITDFLRIKLQDPKFKAVGAISEIRNKVDDIPLEFISLSDWQIYNEILDKILSSFSEGFSHSNPNSASDSSRNKIAHGHVVEIETEANSLRQFLYMNEIYRLFVKLDTLLVEGDE